MISEWYNCGVWRKCDGTPDAAPGLVVAADSGINSLIAASCHFLCVSAPTRFFFQHFFNIFLCLSRSFWFRPEPSAPHFPPTAVPAHKKQKNKKPQKTLPKLNHKTTTDYNMLIRMTIKKKNNWNYI